MLLFLTILLIDKLTAQTYYFQAPGKITVSPFSSLLPVTTVTPTGVTSNNPGSTPVAYNTAFGDQVNQIYQFVDRTQVTTGLLSDYGVAFTDLSMYNGVRTTTNYLSYAEWQAVYLTLYSYRFNDNLQMIHPVLAGDAVDNYTANSNGGSNSLDRLVYAAANPLTHYIVGLHLQYQQFKADAISSNLVYVSNNQIHDTPGRPASPYDTKDAFAFAIHEQRLSGSNHNFLLRNDLFFSNTGKSITSVQIDFGDGSGYRTITFNTPVSVSFSSNGVKNVLFRVTYTDNTAMESQTQVEVTDVQDPSHNPAARYSTNFSSEPFPHTNFPVPLSYQGQYGSALVTVAYGRNNGNVIRKPLIVVEGFDPFQTFSYLDLILSRDFSGLPILSGQSLSDLLESNDYDLIFVDFADGADYIQRNAYLVENIIQWVNSVKQPYNGVRQPNVVIGFSMGGLVGRYALKHMENLSIPHETRLYCSFDSPHQGANVPLSFQTAGAHISNIGLGFGLPDSYYNPQSLTLGKLVPEIGKLAAVTFTPAAKQMVLYRSIFLPGVGLTIDNSTRNSFANEYNQLGYPAQTRNVVIANGSECGADQGYQPYAELLNVDSTFSAPGWATFLSSAFAALGTFTTYPQLSLLSLPATKMDIKGQFIANALPNQTSQRIYKGKLYIKRKILGIININITLSDLSMNSSPSFLPLDNSGGGVYDIDEWAPGVNLPFKIKRFAFIPTFSSLDIGGGTQTITYSDLTRQYSPSSPPAPPKNVRANNFVTGKPFSDSFHHQLFANENHTEITAVNGYWLFQEIQGTAAYSSCLYVCSGNGGSSITGPTIVCSTNTTFTLSNVPAGSTISWSKSSNISYVSGQGTTSYVVTSNGNGSGYITATVTGSCGSLPVPQYNVWVGGYSSSDYPVSGPGSACHNQNVYYNTVTLPNATNYTWSWPTDWTYQSGQGTPYLSLNTGPTSYGGAVTVRVANNCDAGGSPAVQYTSVSSCGGYAALSVYPNPTSDEINVSLDEYDSSGKKTDEVPPDSNFQVALYDKNQRKLALIQANDRLVKIPVKDLPDDTYYLRLWYKEAVLQRQILIKKNQ